MVITILLFDAAYMSKTRSLPQKNRIENRFSLETTTIVVLYLMVAFAIKVLSSGLLPANDFTSPQKVKDQPSPCKMEGCLHEVHSTTRGNESNDTFIKFLFLSCKGYFSSW